jgi:hypothetical protein
LIIFNHLYNLRSSNLEFWLVLFTKNLEFYFEIMSNIGVKREFKTKILLYIELLIDCKSKELQLDYIKY